MTTFKPVFVPRAERETQTGKDKRDGRGKDNKKRAKAIVSFEDDGDDEGAALVIAPHLAVVAADKDKARKKKKRRKEKEGEEKEKKEKGRAEGGEEDVGMWVEKEPPQVVASFVSTVVAATAPQQPPPRQPLAKEETRIEPPVVPSTSSNAEGPPRGRKRAIDFL
jgi:G patch domain-containing protein 1